MAFCRDLRVFAVRSSLLRCVYIHPELSRQGGGSPSSHVLLLPSFSRVGKGVPLLPVFRLSLLKTSRELGGVCRGVRVGVYVEKNWLVAFFLFRDEAFLSVPSESALVNRPFSASCVSSLSSAPHHDVP